MSTDRIIVHSDIAPAFLSGLKTALSDMPSDTLLPRVVSATSKARLDNIVANAVSSGAKILFGRDHDVKTATQPTLDASFTPTVIDGVKEDMTFWNEEAFGPVVGCLVVQTEDEAIAIANNTGYGLSAAVFTQDLRRGLSVAKRINSG